MKYEVSAKFKSSVERSSRVLEVAEAFGLGLKDKEFVIYNGLALEVNQGDVVYITGQSGSGKSLLLRDLAQQMNDQGLKVANIDAIQFEDKPLVDQIGDSTTKALYQLSIAGLNDAYLFIRKPSELSDGQKYRFKLAKLMELDADVWVADEFGAVLDRVTAKIVAFNLQKIARKLGKTVIVATTHTDLETELGPNVVVEKRFHDRVIVRASEEKGAEPIE